MRADNTIWRSLLPVAVIIAVAMAAYSNSFAGKFLLDDSYHIVENKRIRTLWPIGDVIVSRYGLVTRPLVQLSLAINYHLGKLDERGYHVWNLAVHILAAIVLFGVVRRTLSFAATAHTRGTEPGRGATGTNKVSGCASSDSTGHPPLERHAECLAFLIALLWAVHPLQTQSVTYVIQRGESMMGLFYLLTLYCFIRAARSSWWYAASVAACAVGTGCKEVMVTAPSLVLIYDAVFVSGSLRRSLKLRWRYYAALAVVTFAVLVSTGVLGNVLDPTPRSTRGVGFGVKDVSMLEYLRTQPGVILHYLRLSLWPHPLCLDYGWPIATEFARVALPLAIVGATLVATIILLRRRPGVGFLGVWFFLILAPTSSFIPIKDLAFEHRMYLPLAAVISAVALGAYSLVGRATAAVRVSGLFLRIAPVTTALIVVAALSILTHRRNEDYHDPLRMWQKVVEVNPNHARALGSLGLAEMNMGNPAESLALSQQGLTREPDSPRLHNNVGTALKKLGRFAEAERHFREVIRLTPVLDGLHAKAWHNIATLYKESGRLAEAEEAYRKALASMPGYAEALNDLGNTLSATKRYDEALARYREAVQADPEFADAWFNLGIELNRRGQVSEATEAYRRAVEARPDFVNARINLGSTLRKQGQVEEAIGQFQEALQREPDNADALRHLAFVLFTAGRVDDAIMTYQRLLAAHPDDVEARFNLGVVLDKADRHGEAAAAYEEVLRRQPDHLGARKALRPRP